MIEKSKKGISSFTWIIIIAVIIIFLYWFYLPVGGTPLDDYCIAQQGFQCTFPLLYNHTTGNLTLTVGQNTGQNWAIAEVLFVPNNTNYQNISMLMWSSPNATLIDSGLQTGASKLISVRISNPVPIGTTASGWLWAKYGLNSSSEAKYIQIGQVKLKANV